jgi:predicted ester cyclase
MGEGMSEANQELGKRHFEETEDFVEHAAAPFAQSAPGRGKGPQAMRASAEGLLTQFPDLHMTVEAVISDGDTMAVTDRGSQPGV